MTRLALTPALAALFLSACGSPSDPAVSEPPETPTPTAETATSEQVETLDPISAVEGAYGVAWNVDEGWPGEYPNGFTIDTDSVVLPARSNPVVSQAQDIQCPLDRGVTIHEWNQARAEDDQLNFIVANQMLPLDVTSDVDLYATARSAPEEDTTLSLKAGDSILVTRYWGEGFGEVMYEGEKYSLDLQELFEHVAENTMSLDEHLWVQLTCDDAASTRAWVLYSEVIDLPGVASPNITEYGIATDVTE